MKLDEVTEEFVRNHGLDCANKFMLPWQKIWYVLIFGFMVGLFFYRWDFALLLVNGLCALVYFSIVIFRVIAGLISLSGIGEFRISKEEANSISDEDLPIYTILVPLYKEANIANKIVRNMNQLNYPKEKLDIKLLLEEDDDATQNAVKQCNLPDYYDVMIVADSQPKTKPKACNHGLKRAKGEFCVIYDAEDRPDPEQLRKVVYAFRNKETVEKNEDGSNKRGILACIQAKLNYYNAKQNWLTRFFTIEYSTTFDLYLPGLQCLNVPVPLGGTSNHFRTSVLKELGGWDPFNVTEDCDLGIRIYKRGYKTKLIDSTTWEEANSDLWNWVRQRSRWVKGFFQTHLTHMRNPVRTLKGLGPWGFFGFYMSVGGSSLMMVFNVVYWLLGLIYLGLLSHAVSSNYGFMDVIVGPRPENYSYYEGLPLLNVDIKAWPMVYRLGEQQDPLWTNLSIIFFIIALVLIVANLLFVFMHILACLKRKYYFLLGSAVLMPIYWVLISIGAWKGFIQLFTNPFYWEKTIHGLDGDEHEHQTFGELAQENES